MRGRASGKCVSKKSIMSLSVVKASKVDTGAKRVQVNDLSCFKHTSEGITGRREVDLKYIVGQGNKHEFVSGPNMQMVRVQAECSVALVIWRTWWDGKFEVVVIDVALTVFHSAPSR